MLLIPVTKQMMLYDIGTRPGERLPVGILEPLYKPPTVQSEKPTSKPTVATGSKAGSRASQRSQVIKLRFKHLIFIYLCIVYHFISI